MSNRTEPPRNVRGQFTTADPSDQKSGNTSVAGSLGLSASEYADELAAATKLKDVLEKERAEQAIFRVEVTDEEVSTILTVAMMADRHASENKLV